LVAASEYESDASDVGEGKYDKEAFGCGSDSTAPKPMAVVARIKKSETGKESFMVA
jgi:hypothetical protein